MYEFSKKTELGVRVLCTLILLLGLAMGLMFVVGVALSACQRTDPAAARAAAGRFIQNIPDATSVECAQADSDGDGYCSCTVFRGDKEPLQIQCGCEAVCLLNCVRGCKYQPTVKLDRNGR